MMGAPGFKFQGRAGGLKENSMRPDRMARVCRGFLLCAVACLCGLPPVLTGCRQNMPDDVFVEENTTEAIVFVKAREEETLNRTNGEANLFKLSPIAPDGAVTPITNYAGASISDPCVSFDGRRILFSMRPPGAGDRNIFEIRTNGSGLRQITSGGGRDFDPLYLPNGKIMFTSSRANEMDEYNFSPSEVLYICNDDGSEITRVSFNMSDDFDPTLMPDGRIIYTRWEHFGSFNRFPLFFCNPDGTKAFHKYGPHNRNFFHPQPIAGGRLIVIESTRVNEDAGPVAVLKVEMGPADPPRDDVSENWDVLTDNVNNDGAPWAYGAFKYPFPLGGDRFVVSYTLPAGSEEDCDYGLYTFRTHQDGAGSEQDPATISLRDLTFLYNDPDWNEYDAQLIAAHEKPPVVDPIGDASMDSGVFLAHDVFNRSLIDGQEVPVKGVDPIDELAVIVGIPTMGGEPNDFSANQNEKRALLGFAPVYPDGSFAIEVPANVPISFATLDAKRRAIVNKRTWIYVHPGELVDECTGCHKDRGLSEEQITNPNPYARTQVPTDLNVPPDQYITINYENDIGPLVKAQCESCHRATTVNGSLLPPPGNLDLSAVLDTTLIRRQVFPRAYINLSGESETSARQAVTPLFPRRSVLIDYLLGLGDAASQGPHPSPDALTPEEEELFILWVTLGAQYR